MELKKIIEDLKIIYSKLPSRMNAIDCYLFGSILTNPKQANDVDVLIIYEDPNHLNILKEEFKLFSAHNPVHISYFTFSEERELNFIKQQKAEKIFSL